MTYRQMYAVALTAILVGVSLCACQNLPGTRNQQATAGGGAAGAAIGAALGDSALATLLGGALGAGAVIW